MEFRDTKIAGGPPDDPPPYSAAPTGQAYPSGPAPGYSSGPAPAFSSGPDPPLMVTTVPPTRAVIHTVVVNQMGPTPAHIICRSCNHQIVTRVEAKPTIRTHLFALILCLIGCWPFACVPYCMDSCNSADHYCPSCNAYIGSYVN